MVQIAGVSLEIMDAVPKVVAMGMASACFVVLAAGLFVGCFKTFTAIVGRG